MSYFGIQKYNDNLYQFKDPLGVLSTLLIGKEKALLFDTCYGIGDLKEEVRKITDKEIVVVCSHGHMDHSGGNYQFNKVLIHKDDIELCKKHNSKEKRMQNVEAARRIINMDNFDVDNYLIQNEGNLEIINVGEKIDLGGISASVIAMEGHTKGSIGLFIKKMKLLLVSDATCPFIWLFLEESLPVSTYIKMLERTIKLDFDNFLVGHGARMFPKSKMIDFLNIAKDIDLKKSVKVEFKNFENANSYCYTRGKMYDQNDCGVVFDPRRM